MGLVEIVVPEQNSPVKNASKFVNLYVTATAAIMVARVAKEARVARGVREDTTAVASHTTDDVSYRARMTRKVRKNVSYNYLMINSVTLRMITSLMVTTVAATKEQSVDTEDSVAREDTEARVGTEARVATMVAAVAAASVTKCVKSFVNQCVDEIFYMLNSFPNLYKRGTMRKKELSSVD